MRGCEPALPPLTPQERPSRAAALEAPGRSFCQDARSAQENRILGGVRALHRVVTHSPRHRDPHPLRKRSQQHVTVPARGQLHLPTPARSVRSGSASQRSPSPVSVVQPQPLSTPPQLTRHNPPPGPRTGPRELTPCSCALAPLLAPQARSSHPPHPRPVHPPTALGGPCGACCS